MIPIALAGVLLLATVGEQGSVYQRTAAAVPQRALVLAIEDGRNPTAAELKLLVELGRTGSSEMRAIAVRALGRLERRDLVPVLLDFLRDEGTRDPAALALAVTLRAHAGARDPDIDAAVEAVLVRSDSALVLAHLPYRTSTQVEIAEAKLLALTKDPKAYASVASAFESIARRQRLQAPKPETVDFLRRAVARSLPRMDPKDDYAPLVALAALASFGIADEDLISTGLRDRDEHVRRVAVAALSAGPARVDDAEGRTRLTRKALHDGSHFVRYEAVRAWARHETLQHGCGPMVEALSDSDRPVVLLALDMLGQRCLSDESITDRLAREARVPATIGEWQREAHAFLALARRSPERAAASMPAFVSHSVWQVRMYAARAAAAMNDVQALERLAYDSHHNVREAVLVPLRRLKGSASDAVIVAALAGTDYQLLRTAAIALKGSPPDADLATALRRALERVTKERKDTSRDTRLALIERLREVGGNEGREVYERLLRDFDPRVAAAAADACSEVSSRACAADPQLAPRPPLPTFTELTTRLKAVVELETGRRFTILLHRDTAPLSVVRFVRLARAHYYDGLTFHRVEPAFVVQGGSPGANEYAGDGPFMRDELGGSHRRGTVGVSTRGRDTGDAQVFVNLVDNPRLDFEYTVFGHIPLGEMRAVDEVREGTRILRIAITRE